jgi:hypothetical protein
MSKPSRLIAFAALVLSPAPLFAQGSVHVEFIPQVGLYAPLNDAGAVAPTGTAWFLQLERMEPAMSFGAAVQLSWPSARLGTRFSGLATLESSAPGFFDCYPGLACPAVLLTSRADVSVFAALGDLLFSPLGSQSWVNPYLLLGAGAKHYRYSWPDAAVLVPGGSHDATLFALHGGFGLSIPIGQSALRAEVSDLWSPNAPSIRPSGDPGALSARGRAQHDLSVSLGWALFRF